MQDNAGKTTLLYRLKVRQRATFFDPLPSIPNKPGRALHIILTPNFQTRYEMD
jgi:hypothetical protein